MKRKVGEIDKDREEQGTGKASREGVVGWGGYWDAWMTTTRRLPLSVKQWDCY